MKKHRMPAIMLALTFILAGGNSNKAVSSAGEIPETGVEETSADTEITERDEKTVTTATLPKEMVQIPEDYFEESCGGYDAGRDSDFKRSPCFCRIFHGIGGNLENLSILSGLFPLFYAVQRKSDI